MRPARPLPLLVARDLPAEMTAAVVPRVQTVSPDRRGGPSRRRDALNITEQVRTAVSGRWASVANVEADGATSVGGVSCRPPGIATEVSANRARRWTGRTDRRFIPRAGAAPDARRRRDGGGIAAAAVVDLAWTASERGVWRGGGDVG